jgi:hypothetical protein
MSNTTEITASPKLRAMFVVAAAIMFALWGWSLVPPIENWGNPNEDGFSYVAVFYTTITCLPVGLCLLDLTGDFCTRRFERNWYGKEPGDAEEEVQCGADRNAASAN